MSIFKVKLKNGFAWRAQVRVKGHPTVSANFQRKQEAQDWKRSTLAEIKAGKYRTAKPMQKKCLADLIDRYIADVVDEHHKASADTRRHLAYFKKTIGQYALVYITPELLIAERKKLLETPAHRDNPRNSATVNRYMSSISGALRYGWKNLRWLDENPCISVLKLKEDPKTRRILALDEEVRLLRACRQSKNKYLFCITLMALTTGARQGEILALTWDCIDYSRAVAHIKTSKNGKSRYVKLPPSVMGELHRLEAVRDPSKPLVFASRSTYGKIDPKKAWQGALQVARIEDFVFHGLRHHYASFGGKIGATGVQLRGQMGHSSSAMTDHYVHSDAEATSFIGEEIEKRLIEGLVHLDCNVEDAC